MLGPCGVCRRLRATTQCLPGRGRLPAMRGRIREALRWLGTTSHLESFLYTIVVALGGASALESDRMHAAAPAEE